MAAAGHVRHRPGPSRRPGLGLRPPTAGQDRTIPDRARTSQLPYPELPAMPGQVRAAMLGASRRARPGPGPPPPRPELAGARPDLDRRARSSLELVVSEPDTSPTYL
jgi:hypothetical protein